MEKLSTLVLVFALACTKPPAAPTNTINPDIASPLPTKLPTTKPILLVANKEEATLSVLELPSGRALATLPTGRGPHEIALSPDGRRAVVSNYGDQQSLGRSLTVIDLVGLSVVRTIDLGEYRRPHGIAFLDDKRVIVTAEVNASVVIVDVDTATIERGIFTSQPGSHMLVLTPDKQYAYVTNIQAGTISPIDLATYRADDPIPAISTSEAIAVTPDGSEIWTASLHENKVVVLDRPKLLRDAEILAAGMPIRLTITPDGKSMLVSNVKGSKLQIIDTATRDVVMMELVPLDGRSASPLGATISSDSQTAYVALVAENRIAVIDLPKREITGYLPVGEGPDGIVYSSAFVPR